LRRERERERERDGWMRQRVGAIRKARPSRPNSGYV
jgi:hypothetical protein